MAKGYPTLAQIANKYKTLAVAKAPRKTGNLKDRINTYNRPSGMIKRRGKLGFELVLDVSPPGAEYGKYWNSPYGRGNGKTAKIKRRYPDNFDFDNKAYSSDAVQSMINKYIAGVGMDLVEEEINKIFLEAKGLYTIS